jgi:long-chain acyl-CoA synthetase
MSTDFFERLKKYAETRPNQVALQSIRGEQRQALSWQALQLEVYLLSRRLQSLGTSRRSSHVGLLMEDSPMWGVAFLAAYSAGWVAVPLDPSWDSQALCRTVSHAECEALIFSKNFAANAQEIAGINHDLVLLEVSPTANRTSRACGSLPLVTRDSENDLAILYTGGTTGFPKGVRLNEANLFWSIWDMLAVCPVTANDHILSILPLFHVMPLLANLLGPLYVGARVTYLLDHDPARILSTFRDEGITAFLCVPQFYYLLIRRIMEQVAAEPAARRIAFHRLLNLSHILRCRLNIRVGRWLFRPIHARFGPDFRLFGVGAASFAPEAAETLLNLGFNLFQAYGMTETAGLATVDPAGRYGGLTCGSPVPHAKIRIHEPDRDGIGEILIAGEHLTPGYWKESQATVEAIRDGWLWSGDLGCIDRSGRLIVTGRRKEVIVLATGCNVFPEQVEYQIRKSSEFIKEVCVVGRVDGDGVSERLHAVIVPDFDRLRSKCVVNIQDQIRYDIENATRLLPASQRMNSLEFRDIPLPRTSTGKLKRFDVFPAVPKPKTQAGLKASEPGEPALFGLIRRIKTNCGPITPESHLELELGFDSLERVELLSNIRTSLGLEISDEQAARIFTVEDLLRIAGASAQTGQEKRVGWREILRAPLSDDQNRVASRYLSRQPVRELAMYLVCRLAGLAAKIVLKFRVTGIEEIPREYPFVLCANHASFIDALLIAAALPRSAFRRLFFLGAEKYTRTPFQRWLGQWFRSVSIDAGAQAGPALRIAYEGLKRGFVLCVFPEGHRSIDGVLLPFHKGPAILAIEGDIPIVPVGIIGTQKVWGRASRRFRPSPVEVRFGPTICSGNSEGAKLEHEQLTVRLQGVVEELLRQTGRGASPRRPPADPEAA